MYQQNVTLKTQTKLQDLEVIGQGGMVTKPRQIGEWWVMPADQYKGTIPADIQTKWDNFKALGIPVLGYLIADDMREVQMKREQEAEIKRQQRKEKLKKTAHDVAVVGGKVVKGIAVVAGSVVVGAVVATVGIIGALIRYDPVLIAVMPDGRWICIGSWWTE